MINHWIAVASAAHVRMAKGEGFMQVCHGNGTPLEHIKPGDAFRFGMLAINADDFKIISGAMGAKMPEDISLAA